MNTVGALGSTQTAILGLVAWFAILLLSLEAVRSIATLKMGKPANSFDPTGRDLSTFGQRLTRAHANAYEFLPFPLAVLLYALATNQAAVTDGLALWLLAARIGQSLTHLASTSNAAVLIRFLVFFVPQQAILIIWLWWLAGAG